ncbi:DUF3558 family protein [Plantactinospora siamensis]|uniref:DUF3558 family protein n=1 Tax=Plantactinospora siamensis TaxID=555372 RepID=A0ABV6NTE9_9ACTN
MALATVSGCGTGAEDADVAWKGSASPTASTGTAPTASASTAPARPAKLTSACKLLPAKTVNTVLGGTAATRLSAHEEPVEKKSGRTRISCSYGRDGNEPFALLVSMRPGQADEAEAQLDGIAANSGVKATRLTVHDAGAVTYAKEGMRSIAVAVPYQDELRLVIFAAPQVVPQSKLVDLAEHVVKQV